MTAADIAGLPPGDLPEVAFVGRSNAGKSTCINTLTQQKRLAFASKTPGRTQHINYFAVGYKQQTTGYLVDLPGYGYAAVPKTAKLRWQRFLAEYLATRESLRALVLIVDSRLGVTPLDLGLLDFMNTNPRPVHVLLGKADKLSGGEKTQALRRAEQVLGEYLADNALEVDISLQSFSATKRDGLDELSSQIETWITPEQKALAR
jgi:GTP-binding protein